jgi:hypothetical protein
MHAEKEAIKNTLIVLLRMQKFIPYPKLGEADPGGLGASPQ